MHGGCRRAAGGTTPAGGPTAPPGFAGRQAGSFNPTDVMFLQMMIPHHGQGLEMARLAEDRATRAEVRTLAAAIDTTQAAEVQTMSGWLRTWGQPPTVGAGAHAAHGGMPETSAREIASLERAAGADFERRFLNMMIAHQDDAIQLARMEASGGIHPQAKDLALRIDRSRSAQISQMLKLLAAPGRSG